MHIAYGMFFASLFVFTVYSSFTDNTVTPNTLELAIDRSSDFHSTSYQKAIEKSRNSAVRLISIDSNSGMVSTTTRYSSEQTVANRIHPA